MLSNTPPTLPPQKHAVTIFVHGTKTGKDVQERFWGKGEGFYHISKFSETSHFYAVAKELDAASKSDNIPESQIPFNFDHFYYFGWAGKLDAHVRADASEKLFDHLEKLRNRYNVNYGVDPHITIIPHSHGGNVNLGLGCVYEKKQKSQSPSQLSIDRLILLATPIQRDTSLYADSPLFKKIYSLHSHADLHQIGALQINTDHNDATTLWEKFLALFSERHLPSRPHICQACITWQKGAPWKQIKAPLVNPVGKLWVPFFSHFIDKFSRERGLWHVEFELQPFMSQLPYILTELDKMADSKTENEKSGEYNIATIVL